MIFWSILLVVVLVMLLRLLPGFRLSHAENATPLDELQRRYASGELTTEEYDDRRRHL